MQRPQHSCEEYFLHTGPVLGFTRYKQHEYVSLTSLELLYWYRAKKCPEHVFEEAPFATAVEIAPIGTTFTEIVVIPQLKETTISSDKPKFETAICVGCSNGMIRVYSVFERQLYIQGSIRSGSTAISHLCFGGNTLYAVHADGTLRYFDQIRNLAESWAVYSSLKGAAPVTICNGECFAFAVQSCGDVNLLFAAAKGYVEVYMDLQDYDGSITNCGFLSEDIAHRSNAVAHTTAIHTTQHGMVITGAKRGNLTSWIYEIEKNECYIKQQGTELSHKLQFKQTLGTWQHGKKVVQIALAPASLWCYSFDEEGAVVVTDLKYNKLLDKFIAHAGRINSCQIFEEEGIMLTASNDCVAKVWQLWCPEMENSTSNVVDCNQ